MSKPAAKLWTPALGGEVTYSDDLPSCCRSEAGSANDGFECLVCGAAWREVEVFSEGCAFMVSQEREDHRGAA